MQPQAMSWRSTCTARRGIGAGMQRMHLLLSASERRALHGALDAVVPALYALPDARKVRWSLDVDPIDLY